MGYLPDLKLQVLDDGSDDLGPVVLQLRVLVRRNPHPSHIHFRLPGHLRPNSSLTLPPSGLLPLSFSLLIVVVALAFLLASPLVVRFLGHCSELLVKNGGVLEEKGIKEAFFEGVFLVLAVFNNQSPSRPSQLVLPRVIYSVELVVDGACVEI